MAKGEIRDAPYLPGYRKIAWQRPATLPVLVIGVILNLILALLLILFGIELGPFDFEDFSLGAVLPWIIFYAFIQFGWWALRMTHSEVPWWEEKMPTPWSERRHKSDFEYYVSRTYPKVIPMRIYRMVVRLGGDELPVSPRFYLSSDRVTAASPELILLTRTEGAEGELSLYGYFPGGSPMPFVRENFPQFDWPLR